MPGSIICGLDESESAKEAARVARELSARLGLRLVFVRAVSEGSGARTSDVAQRLERLSRSRTEVDCSAEWRVGGGHPADYLLLAASDEKAELIVVGARRADSPAADSVASELATRARCPIIVVPADHGSGVATGTADAEFAGGIVRFGLGGSSREGETDFAGGIARFNFGSGGA